MPHGSGTMSGAGVRIGTFISVHRPGGALWGHWVGAVPIQGHGGEEGGESEVEGKRASASGGHWRPRVTEASRWG